MKVNLCTSCGSDNQINSDYCSHCGQKLSNIEAVDLKDKIQEPKSLKSSGGKKFFEKLIIGFLVVLSGVIVQKVIKKGDSSSKESKLSIDKTMMTAASELNKTCPIMVDKDTRLDNAIPLLDKTFQYNYTLVNYEKAELEIDTLKNYLLPHLTNIVKTNPGTKIFRDNKVTLNYNYKDKNGIFLLVISITPDMYK